MKFKLLYSNFSKLLLKDYLYPIMLAFLIIFELMFGLLISGSSTIKFSVLVILNFFFALLMAMSFLKNDQRENRYFKQRIGSYPRYVIVQMLVLVSANVITAIISGIFSFLISSSPINNATMILTLITTEILGTSIALLFRSQWGSHKYLAPIGLIIFILFALADSNNYILSYVNWILPPVNIVVETFQEQSGMSRLLPLALRQLIYAMVLLTISGLFNKKSYRK
ncbi:hypothetical protein [Companilactobacillus mishanensis]|uniref:Uncharacterized protein n=1 Tax=Companilactobacillus mishanensis TaxID=2486008 RepID=A0A5P0ZJR3_9LACO|nr:hypothetical protein [Companilactobacillus mishanensis]MQS53288.1 hypothetical protein [Companilactobacillus mishanensis]